MGIEPMTFRNSHLVSIHDEERCHVHTSYALSENHTTRPMPLIRRVGVSHIGVRRRTIRERVNLDDHACDE